MTFTKRKAARVPRSSTESETTRRMATRASSHRERQLGESNWT